ncbi:MAG: hypothetical protein U0169_03645 [Polyangiaceae bacterium]
MDARTVAVTRGTLMACAGLWPVVHHESFARTVGPSAPPWFVKTVGVLVASTGVAELVRRRPPSATRKLVLGVALSLAGVDVASVVRRQFGGESARPISA